MKWAPPPRGGGLRCGGRPLQTGGSKQHQQGKADRRSNISRRRSIGPCGLVGPHDGRRLTCMQGGGIMQGGGVQLAIGGFISSWILHRWICVPRELLQMVIQDCRWDMHGP